LFSYRSSPAIRPRRRPQHTRSITVEQEGPNRPTEGRLIPWPAIPCYPLLTEIGQLKAKNASRDPAHRRGLLDVGQCLFTTAGKTALGWAFKVLQLEPGTRVLMPAYHCLAMIEPLEWLGLKPQFYRIHDDLSIDFADLEARVDSSCKALVAVHYFGFSQDGPRLRAFCDQFGLAYIEDCAHSFFGARRGAALGTFGDLAVGSLPKFFPLRSGGCLVSSRHRLPQTELADQGHVAELQTLVRELQIAHYYGRLRPLLPLTTAAAAVAKALSVMGLGRDMAGLHNSPAGLAFRSGRTAERILQSCDPKAIEKQRRENYQLICESLADLPGVFPLKPQLEPGVVPYMVPLRIPALRRIFAELEDRAVPMQRFGQFLAPELDESLCPVSANLSNFGLQLPCHQSLRQEEIIWMVEQLRDVCRGAGAS